MHLSALLYICQWICTCCFLCRDVLGLQGTLFKRALEWETQAEKGLFSSLSSSLLSLPLLAAASAPSAARCASASLPAAASCTPPARGAAAPAAAAVSEGPRTVPCFPAAVSGNHVGGLILQAH